MKIYSVLIIFSFIIITAFQEAEKTGSINDLRKKEISLDRDTSMAGHQAGDLIVNRVLNPDDNGIEGVNSKNGVREFYNIRFFKNYEGKLLNYSFWVSTLQDYDKVYFQWLNDTEVSVTLVNSVTNKKSTNYKLSQVGNITGISTESDVIELK